MCKLVFLSAAYNFAKKGMISGRKAEAVSSLGRGVLSALRREDAEGKAAKLFVVCTKKFMSSSSFPEVLGPSWKKTAPLCSPNISAWGRNVNLSSGVRRFELLGKYPRSRPAAFAALAQLLRAAAGAQCPSRQAHGAWRARGLAGPALCKSAEHEMG